MTIKEIQKIIDEKITDRWVAEHTEKGHFYRHRQSNKLFASVTSQQIIEKPHLVPWAAGQALDYLVERLEFFVGGDEETKKSILKNAKFAYTSTRDDAGNVGTRAHGYVQAYTDEWIKTGVRPEDIRTFIPQDEDGRVFAAARSAERLYSECSIKPIATELLVGSVKRKVAGALDKICMMDDKLCLLDWKTSNSVSDEYALQVVTYATLFEEMTGLEIEVISIVKLSKDNDGFKLYDVPDARFARGAAKSSHHIYRWLNNGKKKLVERKSRIKI